MYNKGWCIVDNSIRRLIELLEPLIFDLDEKKRLLVEHKNELENVSRMLAYTKDNLDMVSIYADQELILSSLSKINSNKDEYRASCYLLNGENDDIKKLPQYEKAYNLISDIVEYFKLYKAELIVETGELEKECQEKETAKKYYNVFSSTNPFVDDTKEFNSFLDKYELEDEIKINILMYAIENNIREYTKKNS